MIGELLEGRIGRQWVAVDAEDKLVGFVTLYYTYSTLRAQKAAVMNDLYVAERQRGAGLVAALFAAVQDFAKQDGCAHLSWETAEDNSRAQRFYEKMGGARGAWITYSVDLQA